jgi:hypothetical protein
MFVVLAVGGLAGCAQAHQQGLTNGRPDSGVHVIDSPGGGGGDTGGGQIDAPNQQQIDAPTQGGTQTLSETTSNADTMVGITCAPTNGDPYTLKTSFYRVFTLSDFGITGTFHVQAVDFGVSTPAGNPPLKVSVGTYNGTTGGTTLTASGIMLTASANINPANTDTTEHVPVVADVTGNLIVEIDQTADGNNTNGYTFYPAANTSGESKPGYIMSAECNVTVPTTVKSANGNMESDIVITVTGST